MLALAAAIPAAAHAQDFGVMESAETINRDNFKVMAYPLLVLGEGSADNDGGIALRGGYGFTDNFDIEGKVSFFDEVSFFGADAEYWLVKGRGLDVSGSVGFHLGTAGADGLDTRGFDLMLLASKAVTPRLDIFGALDIALDTITDDRFANNPAFDDDYNTVHFVPGVEYKVSDNIDIVGELGLALGDNGGHYLSGGIAYYIR
jgi:hypothetical protein